MSQFKLEGLSRFGLNYFDVGKVEMTNRRTLMAIFAHPDDEAFGTGGTLTKYAHEGVDVHLVMATRGEAGRIANPKIEPVNPLGLLREGELRQACDHYGLEKLHLLGYLDGQTAIVPPSEPVFRIVKLLRQFKPQVVISFGPDGIYGHFDHIVVHRWASAAVELAGIPDRWPEAGPPHQVTKFYYRAMSTVQVEQLKETSGRTAVDMGGIPFEFSGYPAEQITTVIDVRKFARNKLNAIRCHSSQLNPEYPMMKDDFVPEEDEWFWKETFILARTYGITALNGQESDLFRGIG